MEKPENLSGLNIVETTTYGTLINLNGEKKDVRLFRGYKTDLHYKERRGEFIPHLTGLHYNVV